MSEVIRGLVIPGASNTPKTGTFDSFNFNVAERTELSVAALDSLGLVGDKGAAVDHIGKHMQALSDHLPVRPEAGVEPYFAVELSGQFGLNSLIKAFYKTFYAKAQYPTWAYENLWNQYSPAELNSRRVGQRAVAAVAGSVTGAARAMLLGGDRSDTPGLYYTHKNLKQQIKAVGSQGLVNPADYIVIDAQRREAGEGLLDRSTFTRFVQLEKKSAGGGSWGVPDAGSGGGCLGLGKSRGWAYPNDGVRLSVGPEEA